MKLEDAASQVLGKAKKIKIAKEETTIVDGAGDAKKIQARIAEVRAEIANTDF